jgi:hypothetical protein
VQVVVNLNRCVDQRHVLSLAVGVGGSQSNYPAVQRFRAKLSPQYQAESCGEKMSTNKQQFLVDGSGNRTGVVLAIDRYSELLEAQEELEAIRAYDEAKATDDEAIPFAQAVKEIEGT